MNAFKPLLYLFEVCCMYSTVRLTVFQAQTILLYFITNVLSEPISIFLSSADWTTSNCSVFDHLLSADMKTLCIHIFD